MNGPTAHGDRSNAVAVNNGIVNTGDHTTFNISQLPPGPDPRTATLTGRVWNVPRRPSRVFVGRDTALDRLAAALHAGSGVVGQSLAGLGGIGKTELALHHVFAVRETTPVVWWIVADPPENITAGLAGLACHLEPDLAGRAPEAAATWALLWLLHHDDWLLVFDNVDHPGHIAHLLAIADRGRILITTRRDIDWEARGLTPIRLGPLTAEDGCALLLQRTEETGDEASAAARKITTVLGGLPLALEQSAGYITANHTTLAGYARQLADQPATVFAAVGPVADAQRAITRVWNLTLTALRGTNPDAVHILDVLAWLGPDDLPRHLASALLDNDQTRTDQALGLLASYSMITLTTDTISIHRLVQTVLRHTHATLTDTGLPIPAHHATTLLNAAVPEDPQFNADGWPIWRTLIAHITALAEHSADLPAHDVPLGRLLNWASLFQSNQGSPTAAGALSARALAISEAVYGPGHPTVAVCLDNLAVSYRALGGAAGAVPLQERALAITEAACDPDHPDVAIRLGNLAGSYSALGRSAEAVPLEQRALAISEAAYGPDHPIVAICLGNLAVSYRDLGRPAEAVPLEQRALAISEAVYGPDHPDVAIRLGNLASSYRALGRSAEAVPLEQRALAIAEAAYGPDHPIVAVCLGNLAVSYRDLGRSAEAVPLEQRALAISEAAYGPDHLTVAICLGNLANSYRGLGRPAEAVPLQVRALAISEAVYGPDHPDVAIRLGNLAVSYSVLGRAAEAVPLQERALAIAEAAYGPNHPDVAICLGNLAYNYRALGRAAEAVLLQQRVLAIVEPDDGPNRPR